MSYLLPQSVNGTVNLSAITLVGAATDCDSLAKLAEAWKRECLITIDALKESEQLQDYFDQEHRHSEQQRRNLQHELDRLAEDLQRARYELERKERKLANQQTFRTALDALELAETLYGDRLIILNSARDSAAKCGYRKSQYLFEVLTLIALAGQGGKLTVLPELLKSTLGNRAIWKPKDSPQTRRAFAGSRDFISQSGERVSFKDHVTIGHGASKQTCMQVYFRFLPSGQAEIAYAGEHLPTVSVNT